MIFRKQRDERRVSPSLYKLLLTSHITLSVGWLGVVFAKLFLGIVALTAGNPSVATGLYAAMQVVNPTFPPLAIGTALTGVLLSLGTRWGLLRYYWVVTKQVLTVGVVATAVRLNDRLVAQVAAPPAGPALNSGTLLDPATLPASLLVSLAAVHLLMLAVATILSVYKPWGPTWFGQRQTARAGAPTTASRAA